MNLEQQAKRLALGAVGVCVAVGAAVAVIGERLWRRISG